MISATLAMSVGIVLWFLSFSAGTYPGDSVGLGVKLLSAVLPNAAISWGFISIVSWETSG
jgi:hypothetical protein